jgi:hypothetical protein
MNTEFLQDPQFLKRFALCMALIVAGAFIIGAHPFKKKRQAVVSPNLTMGENFVFLRTIIRTCNSRKELEQLKAEADDFFNEYFNSNSKNTELKQYYSRLLEVISAKESEMVLVCTELKSV